MSTVLWIVVAIVAILLLVIILPLLGVILLRAKMPHSKKKDEEQKRLNKKTKTSEMPVSAQNGKGIKLVKRILTSLLVLLIIASCGALLYWGLNTRMSLADVGSWATRNWLPLLIGWGLAATLIALTSKKLGTRAKVLQLVLAGAMFVLFVGILVGVWIPESSKSVRYASPRMEPPVPLASSPMSSWTKLPVAGKGTLSGFLSLPHDMHHIRVAGNKYLLYTVYADGSECSSFGKEKTCRDGGAIGYYIKNESEETDVFLYAFVPKSDVRSS